MIKNVSNLNIQIDNSPQNFNNENNINEVRKFSDTTANKIQKQLNGRFPQISEKILEEAINKEILPPNFRDKLITNPNKYSVFFARFDMNSSLMKEALKNLNLKEEDAKTLSYYEFSSQSFNTLNNVISYLYYLTEHYHTLKSIVNESNRLKKFYQMQQSRSENSLFYTQVPFDEQMDSTIPQQWYQSKQISPTNNSPNSNNNYRLNTSSQSQNGSRMNKSLLEKSRTLKTYDDKKNISKQRYGKYDEVIGFVRNQKINNLSDQRRYERVQIPNIEKKIVDRSAKIQKEVEKKAKELREKLQKAQEKVRQRLERQEMLVEKKMIEIDATGEKYEELKKKREEEKQIEIAKIRIIKQKKAEEIQKKREQREQEEYQKRLLLNQQIEKKENVAGNVMRRIKSEHDRKFQQLNLKYDDIISNSQNLKDNGEQNIIQKMCENQFKRIEKVEVQEKAKKHQYKLKQIDSKKKLEKLQNTLDLNATRNENKIDKIKSKIENKFIRIDKVIEFNHQKSLTLNATNTNRHNRVQNNFANELYKYALKQDRIMKKHTDIDKKNIQLSNSSQEFFDLNHSLTSDLFQKREEQFDRIK